MATVRGRRKAAQLTGLTSTRALTANECYCLVTNTNANAKAHLTTAGRYQVGMPGIQHHRRTHHWAREDDRNPVGTRPVGILQVRLYSRC